MKSEKKLPELNNNNNDQLMPNPFMRLQDILIIDGLRDEIFSYLNLAAFIRLARVNRQLHGFIFNFFNPLITASKNTLLPIDKMQQNILMVKGVEKNIQDTLQKKAVNMQSDIKESTEKKMHSKMKAMCIMLLVVIVGAILCAFFAPNYLAFFLVCAFSGVIASAVGIDIGFDVTSCFQGKKIKAEYEVLNEEIKSVSYNSKKMQLKFHSMKKLSLKASIQAELENQPQEKEMDEFDIEKGRTPFMLDKYRYAKNVTDENNNNNDINIDDSDNIVETKMLLKNNSRT